MSVMAEAYKFEMLKNWRCGWKEVGSLHLCNLVLISPWSQRLNATLAANRITLESNEENLDLGGRALNIPRKAAETSIGRVAEVLHSAALQWEENEVMVKLF